jgi:hypothetical protein
VSLAVLVTLAVGSLLLPEPAFSDPGSDQGSVTASITVLQGPVPCILLGTDSITYDPSALSRPSVPASINGPTFTVESCATEAEDLLAKGTDATGSVGASWALTPPTQMGNMCDTQAGGINQFAQRVLINSGAGGMLDLSLGLESFVEDVPPSTTLTIETQMFLPCTGSDGVGETMSSQIMFTAVLSTP